MQNATENLENFLLTFQPISKEIDFKDLLENLSQIEDEVLLNQKKITLKKYKDALYVGQLNSTNKREGKGIMFYFNGRRYEGDW